MKGKIDTLERSIMSKSVLVAEPVKIQAGMSTHI